MTTQFTEEQLHLLGQVIGGISTHEAMETQRLTLLHPREEDVEFWFRTHVVESKNAIHAHMELYAKGEVQGIGGGNPGRWDKESSYGALQAIEDQLAEQILELTKPIGPLSVPLYLRLADRVVQGYLSVSRQMPLVKEGATTNNDAAKYAKLLTTYLQTLVNLLSPTGGAPLKLWDEWRNQRFL